MALVYKSRNSKTSVAAPVDRKLISDRATVASQYNLTPMRALYLTLTQLSIRQRIQTLLLICSTLMKITEYVPSNPQGKGHVGLLLDWEYTRPRGAIVKTASQLLADYFTSMLILSATFKFKPVVGQQYHLYWMDTQWSLSLIAPSEWSDDRRKRYVGKCELHPDMTWTMNPSQNLAERESAMMALGDFHDSFVEKMSSDDPLERSLPVYVARFPYYQRLFASALTRSLKASMKMGGQMSVKSKHWLEQLPSRPLQLLDANVDDA